MRMNLRNRKLKNLFLTMMLIVAMAFMVVGCGNKEQVMDEEQTVSTEQTVDEEQVSTEQSEDADQSVTENETSANVIGEGKTVILFSVIDKDGNETDFEIHTDKETVGDALLEHNLIAGEESEYGLYVKEVNGITADYDKDQTYWAFYVGGEYASSGVDSTPVQDGESYSFKIEK